MPARSRRPRLPALNPDDSTAPASASATPRVSVLVRSLDRPSLQEALASVAAQTHPNLEVVVIAARPGHAALPERIGAHPLRLLDTDAVRPRSVAANAGLDAARGEYLLFLDDDDWLMPTHVARLVAALQAHPQCRAAYAGVALVDAQGQPLGQAFDLPFDAVRQLSGNLTPIHAVLFSASLRDAGCRFDESLDRYEDWDFWVQVARHTTLQHVGGVSAVYRIHASSGVHEDAGADSASSLRVQQKWLQRSTPRQLGDLMRRVWAHDEVATRLADAESRLQRLERALAGQASALDALQAELRAQLQAHDAQRTRAESLAVELARLQAEAEALRTGRAELQHRVASLSTDLQAVHASSSWRLTAPLRWLAGRWSAAGRR